MDSYVYTPDPIDPDKIYQLVVGVHGAGGSGMGAAGLEGWAKRGDVIVIGPSFVSNGDSPYQTGDGVHADKLIALFKDLKKEYKLSDKMFVHGFSGGSQFAHRFAMSNPKYVSGISAHSGGTWSTDNYGQINSVAKNIPFAISCGEADTGKAGAFPYTRLEWYGRFRDEINKKKFFYIGASWPAVGHAMSEGAWDLCKQCFQLATGLPGESATQEIRISEAWENIVTNTKNTPRPSGLPQQKPVPSENADDFSKIAQAVFTRAQTEQIPDEKLIVFMKKYPPSLWKNKAGSANLLQQCERAAKNWHASAPQSGPLADQAKKEFQQFANGLDLPEARPSQSAVR